MTPHVSPPPPGVSVLDPLPAVGTAMPVIIENAPSSNRLSELPTVGTWIKLKVVEQQLVKVGACDMRILTNMGHV